jgi:hypothetical protein
LVAVALAAVSAPGDASLAYSPRRIVLGETRSVTLKIKRPGQTTGMPRLEVSEGNPAPPTPTGPGEWTATLPLPVGGAPRWLFASAIFDGDKPDIAFAAIPLRARALVPATTEPGTRVTLSLGGEEFGPIEADANGHVEVKVTVPPGVQRATVRAIAPGGTPTSREVDLGVPPPNRLAMGAVATGPAAGRVEVFYVGARAPKPSAIRLSSRGTGKVGEVQSMTGAPGRYWAAIEGTGLVELRGLVEGETQSAAAASVPIVAAPVPAPALSPAVAPMAVKEVQPVASDRRWWWVGLGLRARGGATGGELGFGMGWRVGGLGPLSLVLGGEGHLWAADRSPSPGREGIEALALGLGPHGSARLQLGAGELYLGGAITGSWARALPRNPDPLPEKQAFLPAIAGKVGIAWPWWGGAFFAEAGWRTPLGSGAVREAILPVDGPGLLVGAVFGREP